jgi:hypothetical protein
MPKHDCLSYSTATREVLNALPTGSSLGPGIVNFAVIPVR